MKYIKKNNCLIGRFCQGILSLLLFAICFFEHGYAQTEKKPVKDLPNIVLIYVDDLGYGDIGPYGNKFIKTPNLDKLASEGMKFTQAYAPAPLCSPSRAAMLTGKEVSRLGFEFVAKYPSDTLSWTSPEWINKFEGHALVPPPYTHNLPLGEVTLAEALKIHGYKTALVGKWHVAAHHQVYKGWSLTHGPKQQGFDWAVETFGAHPYAKEKQAPVKSHKFPQDELTEKSKEFIQMNQSPFFLMSSFYFVHTPLKKGIPWLYEQYKATYPSGTKDKIIHYAVNVTLMDHYVGELLNTIEKSGNKENTLVIFTSDNGGNPEIADNGPFRGSKWNLYEGGIRIPMLISWPGKISPGSTSDEIVSQIDFMPTFMELAGYKGDSKSWDGKSLVPLITGKRDVIEERMLSWHFPYYHPEGEDFFKAPKDIGIKDRYKSQTRPHSAWRQGDYKLIYFYEDDKKELYNLKIDPSESNDISTKMPKVRDELFENLEKHFNQIKARIPKVKSELGVR